MAQYIASADLAFLSEYELRSTFSRVSEGDLAKANQAAADAANAYASLQNIERALIQKANVARKGFAP